MRAGLVVLAIIVVAAVVAALNALFIINPMQQALVLQFGQVRNTIREPGLNMKIPFVQDVLILDKRVLDLNVPAQEIIAADQKRLVVDAFMRYRIRNPVEFYQTVNNVNEGAQRLNTFVQASLRAVLADATFQDIVRDNRPQLMQRISADVSARAQSIGVEVVDVKIRRADLPEANSAAIFTRMETEREQEAREIRARGDEAARRIQASADRTATVLRAEARRQSEQIRGEGDAKKSAIFAAAYSLDPNFFAFYRAMQAYEEGLRSQDTRLVLSPDADFFRYFNDPSGNPSRSGFFERQDGAAAPAGGAPGEEGEGEAGEGGEAGSAALLPPASGADPQAVRDQIEELAGDVLVVDPSIATPALTTDDTNLESALESEAEAPVDGTAPSEASTEAAVDTATPPTSAAADAAAEGTAGDAATDTARDTATPAPGDATGAETGQAPSDANVTIITPESGAAEDTAAPADADADADSDADAETTGDAGAR